MRLTKVLLVAGFASAFAVPAFAQGASTTAKPAKAVKSETKAAKKEDKAEHKAFDTANAAPKKWLAGVPKITKAERTQINTIEKKYSTQLSTLKKDYTTDEKAGKEDPTVIGKVQAIVDQARAEIRAALTADQQAKFDANVTKK
jgi:hypothetical protein